MKKLFIILLFTSQLFATNYYVNKNATGANTGLSWTDAWESFADINWASIAAGDYLYISGGSDSLIYYETLTPQCRGTYASRITIIAGKYSPSPSGHSGRVIIDGDNDTRAASIYFTDYGSTAPRYVTVKGFECRQATGGVVSNVDVGRGVSYGCIIDSCYIYDFYDQAGIFIKGDFDSSIVRNCIIKTFEYDGVQTDCFYYGGTTTYYPVWSIIHDNIILNLNQDPNAHNDAIQSVEADGFLIYNNIVINDSVNSFEGGGMPYILSSLDLDYNDSPPVISFNNFLWMGGTWYSGANEGAVFRSRHDGIGEDAGAQSPNWIFNNTFVAGGPGMAVVDQEWTIRHFINNIVASYCEGSSYWAQPYGWLGNLDGGSSYEAYSEIDSFRTNCFWRMDSLHSTPGQYQLQVGGWMHAGTPVSIGSWANWDTYDASNSLFRDPKFVSEFGNDPDHSDFVPDVEASSPVIGAGESIQYLYDYFVEEFPNVPVEHFDAMFYDIYGNPRDIDNPSIGAYEYTTGATDTVPLFNFTSVTNAGLNSYHTTSAVFTGCDSTFHVWTVTSDSFKVGALSSYDIIMVEADSGDTVYITNIASGNYSTTNTNYVVAGGYSRGFSVTTESAPVVPDTIPAAFTLLDYGYANLSTALTSYPFKLTSFDSCNAYFEGENFAIYRSGSWGSPSATMRKVYSTDSIRITLTSSGSYSTPVSAEFTAGGVSDVWYVTTKGDGQGVD